jgi:plastocyanin
MRHAGYPIAGEIQMHYFGPVQSIPTFLMRCLVLAVAVLGVSPGTAGAQTTVTIDILNTDFVNPSTGLHFDPVIKVGDTIHWVWQEPDHSTTSVTSGTPAPVEVWNSMVLNPPATFDHTFTHVGSFQYYCSIHGFDNGNGTAGGMHGVITVQPVPEPTLILLTTGVAGLGVAGVRRLARRTGGTDE